MTSQSTNGISQSTRKSRASWTPQDNDLLRQHWSISPRNEIEHLFPARDWKLIYMHAFQLGLERPAELLGRGWSKEDVAYLCASYGKVPSAEMCARLKRKEHAITEYARRQGLKMPKDENGDTVNTAGKAALRRLLDGSLQSYYWMGYLMADGYMHHGLGQVVLVSAEADKDHMATYAAYLSSKVHCYTANSAWTGLPTDHYRVSVADRRVAIKIAEKFDWKPRKTYHPPSNEILGKAFDTNDQFIAFLIGFIDGDGNINKASHGIRIENHASWITFHQFLLDNLRRVGILDINQQPKINKAGYSDCNLPARFTRRLKHFIDQHHLTVLTRKWDKVNPASIT